MFKNYEVKYLGINHFIDEFEYLVKIIDDDFEENIISHTHYAAYPIIGAVETMRATSAVIQVYSERQLNMARNLTLLVLKINETFSFLSIDHIIGVMDEFIPEFKQYSSEVKQLLLFG